ncbi:MAG: GNAT family N-acetyltransferase, partial [Desulfamplus sp.]|nr:GNAT family N-acetyltransferase [Desulfamplus sp.]
MGRITAPHPLTREHSLDRFDCGNSVLNEWLGKYAWINNKANAAKTFVICERKDNVVGYYSVAMGSIDYEEATPRIKKGLARHPIPVVLLARLAVDKRYQKMKMGSFLIKDALIRIVTVSEHIGARAVLVNAKDENAKCFYEKHQFKPFPSDSLKLML